MNDSPRPDWDDATLRALVEQATQDGEPARRVATIERRPFACRTSFAIDALEVTYDDGTHIDLLLKHLSWVALNDEVRLVKPRFLHNPRREVSAYREFLSCYGADAPRFLGASAPATTGCKAFLMEKVPGVALWQIADLTAWHQAARRLAALNGFFYSRPDLLSSRSAVDLLAYDVRFHRHWAHRASCFLAESDVALAGVRGPRRDRLFACYEGVIARLLAFPVTFIHGECYSSNVLACRDSESWRIWFVDWETAAIGPALMDLAATFGRNVERGTENRSGARVSIGAAWRAGWIIRGAIPGRPEVLPAAPGDQVAWVVAALDAAGRPASGLARRGDLDGGTTRVISESGITGSKLLAKDRSSTFCQLVRAVPESGN